MARLLPVSTGRCGLCAVNAMGSDEKAIRKAAFDSLLAQMHDGSEASESHSQQTAAKKAAMEAIAALAGDITDAEFESVLEELQGHGRKQASAASANLSAEEIADDEFESLLDELHGAG